MSYLKNRERKKNSNLNSDTNDMDSVTTRFYTPNLYLKKKYIQRL